tara:strand:- start:6885 stop:7157 length:273 start_codon:yes stop_codon:yes gene_type:complete
MQLGIVQGTVVCSQKSKSLQGQLLKWVQPVNDQKKRTGSFQIMIDPIGTREGDLVMWVGKREASLAIDDAPLKNDFPVDAAITGIVDDLS